MAIKKFTLFLNDGGKDKKIYTKKLSESDLGKEFPFNVLLDFVPDGVDRQQFQTFTVKVGDAPPPVNQKPVINVKPNFSVLVNTPLTIAATITDVDGTIASIEWKQTSQPTVDFSVSTDKQSITFTTLADPTTYEFEVTATDDKGETSSAKVSVKATAEPEPEPEAFRVGHIGDLHGEHKGFELLKTREKCDFILCSGDVTDTETDDDNYIQTTQNLGLSYGVDFANSQGNHESSEEGGEGAQEDLENAFPALKANKWLQFYHVKNVVFIINNTQISGYSQADSIASKHVMDSLTKAKQLVDSGAADWIFMMQHKPMYIIQNSGHDADYNFRYVHHPAIDAAGADIWVSGHVHIEQRTLPLQFGGPGTNVPPIVNTKMKNGAHDFSQVPHGIICAQNGSSTKSHSLKEDSNPWTAYAADDGDAYTVFEIRGKNLTGKFIDIDTGAVRHEFKVTKEGAGPEPCPPGQHRDPVTGECVPDVEPPECPAGQHWDDVLKKCVPDVQPGDEFDEHGTKLLAKTTGKKVALEVGSNHENGQRYNVNHQFLNYMGLGYFKTSPNQNKLSNKLDGPNHGSCKQLPQCVWMDTEVNLDTSRAALGAEYPHPDNHDAPAPSAKNLNIDTRDKWVGWGVINWTTAEGWRRHQLYFSPDPFNADGTPKNNFTLMMDETDTGQITTPELAKRQIPLDFDQGLEFEVRMQNAGGDGHGDTTNMKWFYVWELAGTPTTTNTGAVAPTVKKNVVRG
jgi:predicted phosphodiesterase